MREWVFDRYVSGVRMAEGARVQARTEIEAVAKARALFGDQCNQQAVYWLRPRQP